MYFFFMFQHFLNCNFRKTGKYKFKDLSASTNDLWMGGFDRVIDIDITDDPVDQYREEFLSTFPRASSSKNPPPYNYFVEEPCSAV